jgi:hypothetical protein
MWVLTAVPFRAVLEKSEGGVGATAVVLRLFVWQVSGLGWGEEIEFSYVYLLSVKSGR